MTKTATVQAQQRWEYMEITRKTETYLITELAEIGNAGWELVSVSYHKDSRPGAGQEMCWTAFLKRPQAGHAPATPTSEKEATPTPAPANQPARLTPSDASDDSDEFGFADTPSDEE